MAKLTGTKSSTKAKKAGILRLLSAPAKYITCKVNSIYKKISKKRTKKT